MRWPDAMSRGVEVGEIARANIYRADAEAHVAVVEPVEVHQAFQRGFSTVRRHSN